SWEWMLRIVNVPAALEARGYPVGVEAELHVQVRDPLLPQNQGRFILSVGDGRGRVQSGGKGTLKLDIKGLGGLYSGHLTPYDLRVMGLLEGPDQALAGATTVFMGPRP